MGTRRSAYCLLSETLKAELDDFLDNGLVTPDDDRYRIACARFLLYLQNKGLQSISQLDYSGLLDFHKDDYHKSSISKDIYEDLIRVFLRYSSDLKKCSLGFSLALNKLLIHQIVEIPDAELSGTTPTVLPVISWSIIERFLQEMASARYLLYFPGYAFFQQDRRKPVVMVRTCKTFLGCRMETAQAQFMLVPTLFENWHYYYQLYR
mgnify:CR=1 FL=1